MFNDMTNDSNLNREVHHSTAHRPGVTKNGTHSPGTSKTKRRADKNSYLFNNSLISVLHNNTYNFKEATEDIYGGLAAKATIKNKKITDKCPSGQRKSSLNNSSFVNNTMKSASVAKKRKRS
jgi:hypothetical protein